MTKEASERMALIRKGSSLFASHGYTTLCDPLVSPVDLNQYIKADLDIPVAVQPHALVELGGGVIRSYVDMTIANGKIIYQRKG